MKRSHIFLGWVAAILATGYTSCTAQPPYPISGQIAMQTGWKPSIYLVQPRHFNEIASDYLGLVWDSAVIETDGRFHFSKLPDLPSDPQLMYLVVQQVGTRFANHLDDLLAGSVNYMPVMVKQEMRLIVHANVDAFQYTCHIEDPSADQRGLSALCEVQKNALAEYNARAGLDEENDTLLLEREKNFMVYAGHLMHFADTTSSLHAALLAIRWISPAGDYERLPEFLQRQCGKWKLVQPDHLLVQELCARSDKEVLPVMIGDTMPEYKLPMTTGDTMLLQQLLGHKLTLLDIWASWCAPCRKENKTILLPMWNQYKDQGLQIVGYSIDSDRDAWQKAITKDGASWAQASHLSGDETPFLKSLRITTIPANFILDAKGKVLAKNVFGVELQNLVSEHLK